MNMIVGTYCPMFCLDNIKYMGRIIDLSKIPSIPRDLIYRLSLHMRRNLNNQTAQLCRRAIVCCINGGIPIHSLDQIRLVTQFGQFASSSFERAAIDLRITQDLDSTESSTIDVISNFKHHLRVGSSESSFRSLFWDQVISRFFFMESDPAEGHLKYQLMSEWRTRSLYATLENRIVDYVALVQLESGGSEIPILLVEAGTQTFDIGVNSHKDFSKLVGIMSKTCISLGYALEAVGKYAEFARAYGLWIGGHQCQLCVAHPVLVQMTDGTYEIHANVTFYDHWKFDLLNADIPATCLEPCCDSFDGDSSVLETIIPGSLTDYQVLSTQEIVQTSREVVEIEIEAEPTTNLQDEIDQSTLALALHSGHFNLDALKKLRIFIKCIIKRIGLITSDFQRGNGPIKFKDMNAEGAFVQSRFSSQQETPLKGAVHEASESEESLLKTPTKQISKKSRTEHSIHLKLAPFSQFFPKIFNIVHDQKEDLIIYEFEKMNPFIDNYGYTNIFNREDENEEEDACFTEKLFESLKFSLHCTYELYILHKVIGIVHSDISPNNILFSSLDNIWKITDFNQSMKIENSKNISRIAGTENYISPTSLANGIFTEESDIFSLGKVIYDHIYFNLLREYVEEGEGKNTH